MVGIAGEVEQPGRKNMFARARCCGMNCHVDALNGTFQGQRYRLFRIKSNLVRAASDQVEFPLGAAARGYVASRARPDGVGLVAEK